MNTAKAFAAAVKDEPFDLVFTGLQSDDYGYAQTGVSVSTSGNSAATSWKVRSHSTML